VISMPKTPEEEVVDRLLLLYLINKAHAIRSLWGRTKLEKLVYCSQYGMMKSGIKGFNYHFYKWKFGPFSDEIYEDIDQLSKGKLIVKGVEDFQVAPLGLKILEDCKELLDKNRGITKYIDEVVSDFKDYDADRIMNAIYETTVFEEKKRKVKDVPPKGELLSKLPIGKATKAFQIDSSWLETLEILLTPGFYDLILKARADTRTMPFTPLA